VVYWQGRELCYSLFDALDNVIGASGQEMARARAHTGGDGLASRAVHHHTLLHVRLGLQHTVGG
jgi:hypothetical protein